MFRRYGDDFPPRPLPSSAYLAGSKRRRYAAPPPLADPLEAIEHVVREVGGFETFRGEPGVVTIGGKAVVLDIEPERSRVTLTYGAQSKEAPWLVERLADDLSLGALGVKLEALGRLDALAASVGDGRDVFEEMKNIMDQLALASEEQRCGCARTTCVHLTSAQERRRASSPPRHRLLSHCAALFRTTMALAGVRRPAWRAPARRLA
jgi:hypothetical protein